MKLVVFDHIWILIIWISETAESTYCNYMHVKRLLHMSHLNLSGNVLSHGVMGGKNPLLGDFQAGRLFAFYEEDIQVNLIKRVPS